jgi:hypothetical protein
MIYTIVFYQVMERYSAIESASKCLIFKTMIRLCRLKIVPDDVHT